MELLMVCQDKFRPEAASDAISGVAVDEVGLDVHVKFGSSRSNHFSIT